MNVVTIFYIVCSASDGEDVRTCKEGQVCGQGQIQNGAFASVLLETDPLEKQAKPFRTVTTEDMIDIIAKACSILALPTRRGARRPT